MSYNNAPPPGFGAQPGLGSSQGHSTLDHGSEEYMRDTLSTETGPMSGYIPGSSQEGLVNLPPPQFSAYYASGANSSADLLDFDAYAGAREPYPAWASNLDIPLAKEEIEDIFIDLTNKFGFQRDAMRNMYDHLMVQLDSRASRMSPNQALLTLHADYIGGEHANYRKWYFAAQLDLDDKQSKRAEEGFRQAMEAMSPYDRVRQLALYLLCWGEAAQVRFVPECLCFIFKCADDYYRSPECQNRAEPVPEGLYLHAVVRPLYRFIRDQGYEVIDGVFARKEKDHDKIIGYDDINQLFWTPEGITRIVLQDRTKLVSVPPAQRFMKFDKIDWSKTFYKTYYEKRSILHNVVNFNRVWIIHVSFFWYYTAYNSPTIYTYNGANAPDVAMQWSAVALGGWITVIIMLLATLIEFTYISRSAHTMSHLVGRLIILSVLFVLTGGPTVYIAWFNSTSSTARALAYAQFGVSAACTVVFSLIPTAYVFGKPRSRRHLASQTFTAAYHRLTPLARASSCLLWLLIFGCKLTESYFFLTLSFKNPIRVLVGMKIQNCSDRIWGAALCRHQPAFTLTIMFIMDLCLFFLDTFLWYVIWNTTFSIIRSFALGISVWTPWKDIFERLPKRIYSKLLATSHMEVKYKPKVLVSQIWNAVIISMYREHLLSIDHVQRLLYHQVPSERDGKRTLRAPMFFVSQTDRDLRVEFFPTSSEASRRISFFAQSLTTTLPEPLPVNAIPTFTVLTPHYSEKILLSLREIIREEDQHTRVTLLEYLKQLHPIEWDNFVKDTKILAEEEDDGLLDSEKQSEKEKENDIPFYTIGFKSAAPEYTLRTRIWASLRAQTLYRTVAGFMNYAKAIKLLYRVENPEIVQVYGGNTEALEHELERMARRKFRFVVSMQRYAKFSKEEIENTEFLLRAYPDLSIAYLEEERSRREGGEPRIFSCLIDGYTELLPNGKRKPKFRIELPGNPILGDGKSDNQNHAIIFHRGEYIQLIDANQDNYLEECLKIRNILGEFEEFDKGRLNPYAAENAATLKAKDPVAIVGAREYIFSENIGILGDVAAGKEQTFGTLAARSLNYVGGKLHYGHPDFLNAIFMTTRGGVSKAQKGLHLNEDIYAGMNAFGRGGRIKHVEYYQCGKGRDLGFGTILNFNTKIGTGMGEQMLSREYYYLGTQLPFDRFMTFYYAHAGFHINNTMVILSVQLFMYTLVFLGTMNSTVSVCRYTSNGQYISGQGGCYNLVPVYDWIKRCVISIFIVFFIAFLPLFLQELMEHGVIRAAYRLLRQFASLSPIFEIFATQVSSNSVLSNLSFGGARYIATGRGFATTRISFAILYSRFAGPSIYLGARTFLLLLYITLTIWINHLIYFWLSIASLCIAPFVFNPHEFSLGEFLIDYREYLRWMSRGNSKAHANSWIGYCRLSRTRITGFKKKRIGHPSEKLAMDVPRASLRVIILYQVVAPLTIAIMLSVCYLFVKSVNNPTVYPIARLLMLGIGPIAANMVIIFILFLTSLALGPSLQNCSGGRFGSIMASVAHFSGLIVTLAIFEFFWLMERFNAGHGVLGIIAAGAIQRFIMKAVIGLFLTRELKHDEINRAWWTGKWSGRGGNTAGQMAREYIVKVVEMTLFTADFILGHFLLFAISIPCLIPYIDVLHSMMLFWLRPSKQIRKPIFSLKQRALRRKITVKYGILFVLMFAFFVAMIAVPLGIRDSIDLSNCAVCQDF